MTFMTECSDAGKVKDTGKGIIVDIANIYHLIEGHSVAYSLQWRVAIVHMSQTYLKGARVIVEQSIALRRSICILHMGRERRCFVR